MEKMSWVIQKCLDCLTHQKNQNKILKSAIQSIPPIYPIYHQNICLDISEKDRGKKKKNIFRNERVAPAEKKLEQKVTIFTCRA